jgi:hypothetical protein
MPQCQFLAFCCFCVSEKLHRKYSRNWTKRSPKFLFPPDTRRSPKKSRRGARGQPHQVVVRVTPWACHPMVWGPWLPSDIAPPPKKSLRHENPKSVGVFPSKVPQRRRRRRPISGDRSLCSDTLPGWGSAPGAISIDSTTISIDFTAISIDVAVSHDEEGVVLPQG